MTARSLVAAGLALAGHLPSALASTTERLVVTLDAPDDLAPEIFCIISDQECSGSQCHPLSVLASSLELAGDDAGFPARPWTRIPSVTSTFVRDAVLSEALDALTRPAGGRCRQCRPQLRFLPYMGPPDDLRGYITCAKNSRGTGRDRIALTYLRFNHTNSPRPLKSLDLLGNQVTVDFDGKVDTSDYEFLLGLGGDYTPDTTGLGVKERMTLRLNPRCVDSDVQIPARVAAEHERPDFELNSAEIDGCVATTTHSVTLSLPYQASETTAHLEVRMSPHGQEPGDVYEASWTEHLPPRSLKLKQRRIGFSWRKDCLIGTLPIDLAADRPAWGPSCPRATLPTVGALCHLAAPGSPGHCDYQCEAPPSMPAFDLPAPVRFDRIGGLQELQAFGWDDMLAYSGQELTSSVPPASRRVIVYFPDLDAWRSSYGNELTSLELRTDLGAPQTIPIGARLPRWIAMPAPNATCTSRFTVDVVGARSFATRTQDREANGNLVLGSPEDYRNLVHWALFAGGGFLNPRNEHVYNTERRYEPAGAIGGGFQVYYAWPFSGAFEVNALYEPTYTGYGSIQLPSQRTERIIMAPYHRGMIELTGTRWGANRDWEVGLFGGGGVGGPIFGIVEKVGTLRWFLLSGAVARLRPFSAHAWIELVAGLRWGEHHEFFGTDAYGQRIGDTFHGEPALTERPLWQLYLGLRWRVILR